MIRNSSALLTRRRTIVTVVIVLVAVLAVWHYISLYRNLIGARDDLLRAKTDLATVGLDVDGDDLQAARERLRSAEGRLQSAQHHLDWDPFIQVARILPITGPQVDAMRDLVDIAQLLVEVGFEAAKAGDLAVEARDNEDPDKPLTEAVVDLLEDAGPPADRIVALTAEIVKRRLDLGNRRLLPPLVNAINRLDEDLPNLANTVERAAAAREVVPVFLGFDGGRRYLVLPLNDSELLPGGGLITAAGILPITDGITEKANFTDSTQWKRTWEELGGGYIEPPGPLKRYLLRDFTWNLLVSNWSPDFPTWSQQALQFYELINGPQAVDGIIAVDLIVLERLLAVTGPKTLEIPGEGEVTFTTENSVLELERLTRQPFEPGTDRKSVIGDLAADVLQSIQELPPDKWATAVTTLLDLGKERHLQVLSFDAAEQTLLRDVGWDGRLLDSPGDFLHMNEASLNSTKLNLIIQPEGTYRIEVTELGDARHELRLIYHNPLDEWAKDKDPDLVRKLMLGGLYGGYFRVFVPYGAAGFSAELDGGNLGLEDFGTDAGRDWFGVFFSLPAGATSEIVLRWSVPLATSDTSNYELLLQKQPGTRGTCLEIEVFGPSGAPAVVEVSGGTLDEQGRTCLVTDVELAARFEQ